MPEQLVKTTQEKIRMTRATTNNHDALVNAATWIVAEFDHYGEVLQLGDGDDDGMYGPTSAIEQLRAALTLAKEE